VQLIFLNRYFYPDHSATSQMLSDLAFALAERRQVVCVITSRQRYDAPADTLEPMETVDGVAICRIWTSRFGRNNLFGRAIDYATFYLSAAWRLWRMAGSGDVVIAKTDPPMLSVMAAPVCWLRGARLVNWLQDIFPETAQALGVGGRAALPLYAVMQWLRNRSLHAADMNVVLGERMAERVEGLGVPGDRIRIIPNWADATVIKPIDHANNALRTEWDLNGKFVVGYSGNLGRAHDVDTLLDAMTIIEHAQASVSPLSDERPSDCLPIGWLFIGSGALFARLAAEIARRGLTRVVFKPYQPKARLAESLGACDVHLVSLRPELEGLIVPSKFYGIAAAGRPSIFIGDKDGEIARLIARHECGLSVAMGDGRRLAQCIFTLAGKANLCREMGQHARQACEAQFDRSIAIARWENLLVEGSSTTKPGFHRDADPGVGVSAGRRNAR
jgi:glycosyltransferase involved in cell wall biosynthesis